MNLKDKSFWKCAFWFVGFESIYWTFGKDFFEVTGALIKAVHDYVTLNEVTFLSTVNLAWTGIKGDALILTGYLICLLFSIWCFKNFVKNIIILLKADVNMSNSLVHIGIKKEEAKPDGTTK